MDFSTIKQKVLFVFVNIPDFMVYIYNYLNETQFFYPLCDK